jgi:hypothetical protein
MRERKWKILPHVSKIGPFQGEAKGLTLQPSFISNGNSVLDDTTLHHNKMKELDESCGNL